MPGTYSQLLLHIVFSTRGRTRARPLPLRGRRNLTRTHPRVPLRPPAAACAPPVATFRGPVGADEGAIAQQSHPSHTARASTPFRRTSIAIIEWIIRELPRALPEGNGGLPEGRGSLPAVRGSRPEVNGSPSDRRGPLPKGRGSPHEGRGSLPEVRGSLPKGRLSPPVVRRFLHNSPHAREPTRHSLPIHRRPPRTVFRAQRTVFRSPGAVSLRPDGVKRAPCAQPPNHGAAPANHGPARRIHGKTPVIHGAATARTHPATARSPHPALITSGGYSTDISINPSGGSVGPVARQCRAKRLITAAGRSARRGGLRTHRDRRFNPPRSRPSRSTSRTRTQTAAGGRCA
jgi:hypothetical protein